MHHHSFFRNFPLLFICLPVFTLSSHRLLAIFFFAWLAVMVTLFLALQEATEKRSKNDTAKGMDPNLAAKRTYVTKMIKICYSNLFWPFLTEVFW